MPKQNKTVVPDVFKKKKVTNPYNSSWFVSPFSDIKNEQAKSRTAVYTK